MEIVLLIIFTFFVGFIFLYSLIQLHLVILFYRSKGKNKQKKEPSVINNYEPLVTIQLPIYNEKYVIRRLVEAVTQLDYPRNKLEIQILDDSNDETVEIVARLVKEYQTEGFNIKQIRRKDRVGYKAGALAYGLNIAEGEFMAIFDADFVPPEDFLRKTLPYFQHTKTGMVQTRWTHLNENYSLLTKLQAFALDAHFTIEQGGRNFGLHFINFNGTAGVWRKICIEDAGGWQSDTLTEDLDLSYRAQLKGWEFQYLNEVQSPAELPVEMNALKSQQFRWTKGAAECTRKNLLSVFRAKGLPWLTKIHALFHLANSFIFLSIIMIALLSIPLLWIKHNSTGYKTFFDIYSVFVISFGILSSFYWASESYKISQLWKQFPQFVGRFFLFLALSMGLSLHNAIAVIEGYIGKKSPFVRTPKFNVKDCNDQWRGNTYLKSMVSGLTLAEIFLAIYFTSGLYLAFSFGDFGFFPFHLLLAFGFSYIAVYTLWHSPKKIKAKHEK